MSATNLYALAAKVSLRKKKTVREDKRSQPEVQHTGESEDADNGGLANATALLIPLL